DGTIKERGIFSQLHDERNGYKLAPADGMIAFEGRDQIADVVRQGGDAAAVKAKVDELRADTEHHKGYWLLFVAGVGILGGWVGGLFHLITHAFFKSLLFLCSGSVIHAVHTNDMRLMGGLRRKMPITAYTMLAGCLAIAGIGIPFALGFSGFHSKDAIVE